ncbi:cell division protein FtsI (penicillin-binding protein 3) [Rubricella aquisinus]|uniref:Cell division protein FtsI (Penicillin-binding protein 3) n=1 Tax=Rubricella aquisinus TaxID=2028108 RepID=A0A840X3U9_9RHOB|nr:penicillin-binding protein 2 [Rubricella aquisinus]MBB5515347.1 cell division protein FtsI (penicillin-binding protein 3) [Rubricella aquisinus]
MIRVPLRPLAKVIAAREMGENPDVAEAERRAAALRVRRVRERRRAEKRLILVACVVTLAFGWVGFRMGDLSFSGDGRVMSARASEVLRNARADIVDRNGEVLATNLNTSSLYVETRHMVDKDAVADGLAAIFPDLDRDTLRARFDAPGNLHWIKPQISPEQEQAVFDLGQPGIFFGSRQMRVYPNGQRLGPILGGTRYERADTTGAEIIGIAGLENGFEERLSDPARVDEPLVLSIDLRVQTAMRDVLAAEMERLDARAAAGILMDANTGEVISMVSLPDFDPNNRPGFGGYAGDSPLFNRASQGVYELGSTFKPFSAALAMEMGVATPETMIDTRGPLRWGRFSIGDVHRMDPQMSVADVIVQSSNVGTARLALMTGTEAQQDFLRAFGLMEPTGLELPEARLARPITPERWSDLSTMTISYGHGISVSPLHMAAAYATLTNGGLRVEPTLLAGAERPGEEARVISADTSAAIRTMLRRVVAEEAGTANFAEVPGYEVGGKTGSADKPSASGGYDRDKVIGTFAAVFPTSAPRYVLVVTLDEAKTFAYGRTWRTAGWTAAPASAKVIRRIVPILGMRPMPSAPPAPLVDVTLTGLR